MGRFEIPIILFKDLKEAIGTMITVMKDHGHHAGRHFRGTSRFQNERCKPREVGQLPGGHTATLWETRGANITLIRKERDRSKISFSTAKEEARVYFHVRLSSETLFAQKQRGMVTRSYLRPLLCLVRTAPPISRVHAITTSHECLPLGKGRRGQHLPNPRTKEANRSTVGLGPYGELVL